MKPEIKIGDWVNSYQKGIFRVERIIDWYYDESCVLLPGKKIGDPYDHPIVISKRLLNSKYKKSISWDSCSAFFVKPLDTAQRLELEKILAQNPGLLKDLDNYKIPALQSLYNAELQIDNEVDLRQVHKLIEFIRSGKTFLEIETEMGRLDILRLKPKYYGNYDFQLINFEEECVDRRKIWREAKLTKKE
ncbi:MAG TPA: hypothetical protein VMH27_00445 [Puia sp.]|nr:hypothetical protein [Puia sp.]